jgi:hypothetical protein
VADRTPQKSGGGISDINQKVEHRTGYQINLRSGATGNKIFTSDAMLIKIVDFKRTKIFKYSIAAHIEDLW